MGKATNYMGNFRAQFPLAILLSDIWFPYLCLPSSGPPSIPVWSSYTSLYLLTTNQAEHGWKGSCLTIPEVRLPYRYQSGHENRWGIRESHQKVQHWKTQDLHVG